MSRTRPSVLIVGPPGEGKTTAIPCLLKYFDLDTVIDGFDGANIEQNLKGKILITNSMEVAKDCSRHIDVFQFKKLEGWKWQLEPWRKTNE